MKQVNIVFDFIGYSKNLFKSLSEAIPKDTTKIKKLIDNNAKGSAFGNYNIVRRFKRKKWTFYLFLNTDFHMSNILLYHSLIYSAKVISSTLMYLLFKSIPLMMIIIIIIIIIIIMKGKMIKSEGLQVLQERMKTIDPEHTSSWV